MHRSFHIGRLLRAIALRHAADRRSVGLLAVHFVLIAAAYALRPAGLAAWLLGAALAWSTFGQLISGHNAMHARVFEQREVDRAWHVLLSLAIGYPVSAFVPVHNLSHHMSLQTPKDVLRTTEVRHRSNLLNLLHHVVMVAVHIQVLNFSYVWKMRGRRPAWLRAVRSEAIAALAFVALLIAIDAGTFARIVLAPYLVGHCMIYGLGYLQHDGCDARSEINHSRNFVGALFNWFIFENGYHTIHHMHPGVHWSRTRAEHDRLVAPVIHPALNERSVLGYMWRTFVWPGRRLSFDGRPVEIDAPPRERDLGIPDHDFATAPSAVQEA